MVSQEIQSNNPTTSSSSTNSSSLHHFLIPNPISSESHFQNPHFDSYSSGIANVSVNSSNPFSDHHSLVNTQFPTIQSLGERMSRSINLVHDPSSVVANPDDHHHSDMGHTKHLMDLLGAPTEQTHGSNRLSLSLGSQVLHSPQFIHQAYTNLVNSSSNDQENCNPGDYSFMGNDSSSFSAFSISSSLYLKPAQSVLEEVIDLGSKDIELSDVKRLFMSTRGLCNELRTELLNNNNNNNGFLSAEKHELQLKISKLITLLEQVEGRYDEYYHRMEELISTFEVVAGEGAAKCYTALALQAMCRHFCSLRDAIVTQIKVARKKISPELPKIGGGLSHLSLFDREARNCNTRMSLQQIGLIQGANRQAWRPIRGLPETSVAILRAWLFEHFLHPYPNDSEKLTLASQTGLTKNQVSNWFINARVRLWKPMIEEMYKEEFGDSSVDSSGEGHTERAEDQ